MIEINKLSFGYRSKKEVLKNINLKIENNEMIAVIGKNGSGKSTLAKLIAGLIVPNKGEIIIDEIKTSKKSDFFALRKKVGMIFQNPENQIIFNNVYDDIAFAIKNLKLDNEEIRIKDALKKVKMEKYVQEEAYNLSLGQKQRVAIAGVLAINPDYIIFDEPTTMLDSEGKQDIYDIILNLKNKKTIIYITNVIDEILMADKIAVLENGEIINVFEKKDILENVLFLKQHDFKLPKIVETVVKMQENEININLENWTNEELTNKLIEVLKNEKYS